MLSTSVQDAKSERPQLVKVSAMNLEEHVHIEPDTDTSGDSSEEAQIMESLLERIHNVPLLDPHLQPQWRIHVLPLQSTASSSRMRFHVAFASSHALADGMSGMIFHSAFLRALRDLEHNDFSTNSAFSPPTTTKLQPPLEHAADMPISWSFLLGPLFREYLPTSFTRMLGLDSDLTQDTWFGASKRPERTDHTELIPTAVRVVLVPPKTLRDALATCRAHNSRLTGLLNHLVARALAQALQKRGLNYGKFITQTAIDLRRCIPDSKRSMGNYVSAVPEVLSVYPKSHGDLENLSDEDWTAVCRSTKRLSEASSTLSDQPIALLKYLSNFREWTLKNAGKPADASFSVSNLGVFDEDSPADFEVEDMLFSQSADGTGAPLNINVASAKGGSLAIVITWWPGMLGVDDEDVFVEEVCQSITVQLKSSL